jgi:hypothetical protein
LARAGMTVSVRKTKAMIVTGGNIIARQYTPAYNRRMTGKGLTATSGEEIAKIVCPLCKKELNKGYLADHFVSSTDTNGTTTTTMEKATLRKKQQPIVTESNAPEVTYQQECSMDAPRSWGICPKCATTLEVAGLQPQSLPHWKWPDYSHC